MPKAPAPPWDLRDQKNFGVVEELLCILDIVFSFIVKHLFVCFFVFVESVEERCLFLGVDGEIVSPVLDFFARFDVF